MGGKPCIICGRLVRPHERNLKFPEDSSGSVDEDDPPQTGETHESLKRLFHLLNRYVNPKEENKYEHVIYSSPAGWIPCETCSKIVESFSALYHTLRSVELRLNWDLRRLKDVMLLSAVNEDRARRSKNTEEEIGYFLEFKNYLVKKCERKLELTFPRLSIPKYQPEGKEMSTVDDNGHGTLEPYHHRSLKKAEAPDIEAPKPTNSRGKGIERTAVTSVVSTNNWKSKYFIFNPKSGKYVCKICSQKFGCSTLVRDHYRSVHLNMKYDCKLCGKEFDLKKYYSSHYRSAHMGIRYKCPACDKVFTRKDNLNMHRRRKRCRGKDVPQSESIDVRVRSEISKRECEQVEQKGKEENLSPEAETLVENIKQEASSDEHEVSEMASSNSSISSNSKMAGEDVSGKWDAERIQFIPFPSPSISQEGASPSPKIANKYKCAQCSKRFNRRDHYNRHYQNIHMGRKFSCENCSKVFTRKDHLTRHQQRSCGKTNASSSTLENLDLDTNSFGCSLCSKTFSSKNGLKTHHNSVHLKVRYKCGKCDKHFSDKSTRRVHHQRVHSDATFKCQNCDKIFPSRADFKEHEKYVACHRKRRLNVDGSGTPKPTKHQRHMCDQCGKDFQYVSSLTKHTKEIHLQLREFVCDECGKRFLRSDHLQNHVMAVHKNLRGHLCDLCGKEFRQKKNLISHKRIVHQGQ